MTIGTELSFIASDTTSSLDHVGAVEQRATLGLAVHSRRCLAEDALRRSAQRLARSKRH
jgi:hypothetical protein